MTIAAVLRADEQKQFPTIRAMRTAACAIFTAAEYGALVTYQTLSEALGLDPRVDNRARTAVLKAGRDVLRMSHKKIVNVRKDGYRIVLPREQSGVSQAEQRLARRRYKRSLETVTFVALDALTPVQVAEVLQEQARAAIMVHMGKRVGRLKALPPKSDLHLPSGPKLLEMMRRKEKDEQA